MSGFGVKTPVGPSGQEQMLGYQYQTPEEVAFLKKNAAAANAALTLPGGIVPQSEPGQTGTTVPALPIWVDPSGGKDGTTADGAAADLISTLNDTNKDFSDAYAGLTPAQRTQFSDVISAVTGQIGPGAFAYQAMSNKDILKRLFPNVPEDQLPQGASLARQINDLYKTSYDESHLDEQYNELVRMQQTGGNIDTILNNYVKGRDTYGKEITKMIDKANTSMFTQIDMSNPWNAKTMNNYMGYLYTIKGRQEQRYADFIKQTTDMYQNDLKTKQDMYKNNYDKFVNEFNMKKDITTEDFNTFSGLLKDMYTQMDGMEEKGLRLDNLRLQNKQAQANLNATVADSLKQKTLTELAANTNRKDDPALAAVFDLATKDVYVDDPTSGTAGKKLALRMTDGDLWDMTQNWEATGRDAGEITHEMGTEMLLNGAKMVQGGETKAYMDHYGTMLRSYADKVEAAYGPKQYQDGVHIQDPVKYQQSMQAAQDLFNVYSKNIFTGIMKYFNDNPSTGETEASKVAAVQDVISKNFGPAYSWWNKGLNAGQKSTLSNIDNTLGKSSDLIQKGLYYYAMSSDYKNFLDHNKYPNDNPVNIFLDNYTDANGKSYTKKLKDLTSNDLAQMAVAGYESQYHDIVSYGAQ